MLSNKNLGIAVTAIAVIAGMMIGVAGPGRAQDKQPAAAKPAGPQFKDMAEFDLAVAAQKEAADPAKRLALLQQWKDKYPATEWVNTRQDMFLVTYQQLAQSDAANPKWARQTFDQALDILKDRPNHVRALYATVQMALAIKPAPTPADLGTAEKNANLILDSPDTVFAAANKPEDVTDAGWAQTKTASKPLAEAVLVNIYLARKDDKRAVDDLRKLIQKDPTNAVASYRLGEAMMRILAAEKRPQDQPPALYQIARAAAYDGPGALPANQKPAIQTYLTNAYKLFHGSTDGLNDVLATAKTNPFPPANFSIKSTVDIANDQAAAQKAEQDKDPIMYTWIHTIKDGLATKGDAFFDMYIKDAGLPAADDTTTPPTPRYYKAKIISISPNPRPKEILVGIEKPDVADAKLTFETALPGKMDIGEQIEFTGRAADWSHDQQNVVITFDVDPKEGLHGTWTGKNAPAGRGGPKGGGANKGTGKAAAPKQ